MVAVPFITKTPDLKRLPRRPGTDGINHTFGVCKTVRPDVHEAHPVSIDLFS